MNRILHSQYFENQIKISQESLLTLQVVNTPSPIFFFITPSSTFNHLYVSNKYRIAILWYVIKKQYAETSTSPTPEIVFPSNFYCTYVL